MESFFTQDEMEKQHYDQRGRVGYLVLWFMGAPITLLLILWVIFGNNLLTRG